MKANRGLRASFGQDDAGAFPVVEAILVAVIVLTAIIFFTSVQRPTTGSEVGGLNLGQFAADTLQVLESHEFNDLAYQDWVTDLATGGDADTATEVDEFISEVLPSGAEYMLRINNGVSTQTILPTGQEPTPNGANAAEVVFVPPWAAYAGNTATSMFAPGEVVASSDARYTTFLALVNPPAGTGCLNDPRGQELLRDGADPDLTRDSWWAIWHDDATVAPYAGKDVTLQIPMDIPLGKWRLSSSATCGSGTLSYINVVAPECRVDSNGDSIPDATSCQSPYPAYGLQLVVWFGA